VTTRAGYRAPCRPRLPCKGHRTSVGGGRDGAPQLRYRSPQLRCRPTPRGGRVRTVLGPLLIAGHARSTRTTGPGMSQQLGVRPDCPRYQSDRTPRCRDTPARSADGCGTARPPGPAARPLSSRRRPCPRATCHQAGTLPVAPTIRRPDDPVGAPCEPTRRRDARRGARRRQLWSRRGITSCSTSIGRLVSPDTSRSCARQDAPPSRTRKRAWAAWALPAERLASAGAQTAVA